MCCNHREAKKSRDAAAVAKEASSSNLREERRPDQPPAQRAAPVEVGETRAGIVKRQSEHRSRVEEVDHDAADLSFSSKVIAATAAPARTSGALNVTMSSLISHDLSSD